MYWESQPGTLSFKMYASKSKFTSRLFFTTRSRAGPWMALGGWGWRSREIYPKIVCVCVGGGGNTALSNFSMSQHATPHLSKNGEL